MAESANWALCGWRVASAVALPELAPWRGDARAPDIVVATGKAPPLENPGYATPFIEVESESLVRVMTPVADYRIEAGRRVTIEARIDVHAPDIRMFLFGTVFGILYHQRGLVPLHAATIEVDGEAVALAAPSGDGKSTLAQAFVRRGHRLIADDVAPVALQDSAALVLPSTRNLRLWPDAAEIAEWQNVETTRCRAGVDKFSRDLGDAAATDPVPLRAVFHLRRVGANAAGLNLRRLRGPSAADALHEQIYRWRSAVAMLGGVAALTRASRTAGAIPGISCLPERMISLRSTPASMRWSIRCG